MTCHDTRCEHNGMQKDPCHLFIGSSTLPSVRPEHGQDEQRHTKNEQRLGKVSLFLPDLKAIAHDLDDRKLDSWMVIRSHSHGAIPHTWQRGNVAS